MGILNIFKKKKVKEKPSIASTSTKVSVDKKAKEGKKEKKDEKKEAKKPVAQIEKGKVVLEGSSSALLISPYLSEKSTILREQENKYIFKVNPRATKNEIKKLLENIYNVEVIKINVINTPAKPKRWRQKKSYFSRSKKMMITIKKGQKIELGI
ncbi:MAG: 50S ribosomal protein L23 [Candidatus Pacebacteria bacterium]|nr:50S ribosomal protein L23 [Candidatus Paceibacterota bacterium]